MLPPHPPSLLWAPPRLKAARSLCGFVGSQEAPSPHAPPTLSTLGTTPPQSSSQLFFFVWFRRVAGGVLATCSLPPSLLRAPTPPQSSSQLFVLGCRIRERKLTSRLPHLRSEPEQNGYTQIFDYIIVSYVAILCYNVANMLYRIILHESELYCIIAY